jgi:hypothetical protein
MCVCDCGNTITVVGPSLRTGATKSCGCFHIEQVSKHGGMNSAEYSSWAAMKQRCLNPNSDAYRRYGGRGITICERWKDSFENFLTDMGPKPTPQHTLDRHPDNDGNYEPSNCRWATRFEQSQTRGNAYQIEHDGRIWTTRELANQLGVELELFRGRVKRGNPLSFSIENRGPVRLNTHQGSKLK